MKNILLFLAVIIALPLAAYSATKTKVPDVRKYKTELNLTQQQIDRLNTVYNNFEARTTLQAPAQTAKERIEQRLENRRQMRRDVAQVLTPAQRREYVQILKTKRTQQSR